MSRVAVDAMGGDHAPAEIVAGALAALGENPAVQLLLVGREDEIRKLLPGGHTPDRVTIVHAAEVVEMDDSPVEALRKKPDNSIAKAMVLVREKKADAFVSAGNTGGCVAAATFLLPRLPNCRRAGIAVAMPTRTGRFVVMDVGANIQCKPIHLVQYAAMATEYARTVIGVEDPRVGVLSVGGEEGKGNPLVQQTFAALKAFSGLRFLGNVEGQQIFNGDADVIVCEGFTGNVILKAVEGLSEVFIHPLLAQFHRCTAGTPEAESAQRLIGEFQTRTDYAAYGGAPLIGHDGAVVISHGRSKARAMKNAVLAAASYVDDHVNERITKSLAALTADAGVAAALGGDA